jgi:uncharacterized membrane protein (Fun14 family)
VATGYAETTIVGKRRGTVMGLIIGLLILWLVLAIIGFFIKTLFWLAIVGIIFFVATAIFGVIRSRTS